MKTRGGSLAAVMILGALALFWAVGGDSGDDGISISATEGSGSEVLDEDFIPEDDETATMEDLDLGFDGPSEPDQLAMAEEPEAEVVEEAPTTVESVDPTSSTEAGTSGGGTDQMQASTSTIVVGPTTTVTAAPATTNPAQTPTTTKSVSSSSADNTAAPSSSITEAGSDDGAKQVAADGSGNGTTAPAYDQNSDTSATTTAQQAKNDGETTVIHEVAKALIVTDAPKKDVGDDLDIAAPATTASPSTDATTSKAPATQTPSSKSPATTKAPEAKPTTTSPPATKAPTTNAPTTKPPTTQAPTTKAPTVKAPSGNYGSNLALIKGASVRNKNHDNSPYANTPSASLNPSNHYGPRSAYLNNPGGNPEQAFPVPNGGQFRTSCEFSHFSYDDPLVYPGKPGAAHLHMNFGNTDVNAFSTADSILNSGSSTCNGQELNRTGYWVPAMFDGKGNVRIPERIVVYYKGEGLARGKSEVYPAGAAMVMNENLNAVGNGTGGAAGKFSFVCANNYSANGGNQSNVIPNCDGSKFKKLYGADDPRMVLEMNVKFPNCWNGKDPSNPSNFRHPRNGSWYYSLCENDFSHTMPNLEYFVNYVVDQGENTNDWYLASDVEHTQFGTSKADGGSTVHGDWWGGWHRQTNQMWIDNCVNYKTNAASGCGMGYLTDGGPNGSAPYDGPALKYRPQYTGPNKVPAQTLFNELCPNPDRGFSQPEDAAYCRPSNR